VPDQGILSEARTILVQLGVCAETERRVRAFDSGSPSSLLHCESRGTPQQIRGVIVGFVLSRGTSRWRRGRPLTPRSNAVTLPFVHAAKSTKWNQSSSRARRN
jgi:hypothetical protein